MSPSLYKNFKTRKEHNMLKKFTLLVAVSILIAGCGAKKPKSLDDGSQLRPNVSVLEQRYSFVPKDPYLSSFNWTYQINATKENGYLLRNEQMVKTFLLAHNATKIIIVGKKELIEEYWRYFKDNQVQTPIVLQDITPVNEDLNSVNIMFFNQTRSQKAQQKRKTSQKSTQTQPNLRQSPCNQMQIRDDEPIPHNYGDYYRQKQQNSQPNFDCLFNENGGLNEN